MFCAVHKSIWKCQRNLRYLLGGQLLAGGHGCYCGAGDYYDMDYRGPAISEFDNNCKEHDMCYNKAFTDRYDGERRCIDWWFIDEVFRVVLGR